VLLTEPVAAGADRPADVPGVAVRPARRSRPGLRRRPPSAAASQAASRCGWSAGIPAKTSASNGSAGTCLAYSSRVILVRPGSPPAHSNGVGSLAASGTRSRNPAYQCMPLQNGLFRDWPHRQSA